MSGHIGRLVVGGAGWRLRVSEGQAKERKSSEVDYGVGSHC